MILPRSARRDGHNIGWWWLAVIALLVITGLRIHGIHTTYMREDEEIAYRTTNRDLEFTVRYQATQDVEAPVWFMLFWGWRQVVGDSEFAARVLSILQGMLTLSIIFRLGWQMFGSARYGLFALILLGVNTYFHVYTMEIRPFALVMLGSALSMWALWVWLKTPTWGAALRYGLTLALLMYTHYFAAFMIVAQVVYVLVFEQRTRRRIMQLVGGAAFGLVVWLPWFPTFISQVEALRTVETASGDFRGLGIGSTAELTEWDTIVNISQIITNGQFGIYALLIVVAVYFLWRRKALWLVLLWTFGSLTVSLLVNLIAAVYAQRYVTYVVLGLALLVGAGLASLPRHWLRWGGLVVVTAASLWSFTTHLPIHTPYRDLFREISALSQPGDVVYFNRGNQGDRYVRWHYETYLAPHLLESIADGREQALEARRIWFVTAHFFDDAVQAARREIEATHPQQQVVGNCDAEWCYLLLLMEAPPRTEPRPFGGQIGFYGADIDSVTREAIQTRLWWQVGRPPEADYSIALQLLDANGRLVAQTDGDITHYGTSIPTSQWQPDTIYIDSRALTLPADLPAGQYELLLIVYQWWDGARLTLPDGSDRLRIDEIVIN